MAFFMNPALFSTRFPRDCISLPSSSQALHPIFEPFCRKNTIPAAFKSVANYAFGSTGFSQFEGNCSLSPPEGFRRVEKRGAVWVEVE
jgi:hypothetical protein